MPRLFRVPFCTLSSLILLTSASGLSVLADEKPQKLVATDESQVDADYWIQGEYMGYVATASDSIHAKKIGLQVIARGQGNFEVIWLEGGLPGDGWNQQQRQKFPGQQADQTLNVQAGEYAVTISGNQAIVKDEQGNELGRLPKLARQSPTLGKKAPQKAIVLFDGQQNDHWKNMKVTPEGLLQEGCETVQTFGDFLLQLEFLLPYKPEGKGQDRGNSGVYLQRRYEIQVLDSFGEPEQPNHCASVYTIFAPDQNMTLSPLTWQTYDIDFRAARFDEAGEKTENARVRVKHNGVVVHDGIEIERKTGAGLAEGPEKLPILLQNHGNPVRFRNVWIVEEDAFDPANQQKLSAHEGVDAIDAAEFVAGGRRVRRERYQSYWPELQWHDFRTPYHNYGYNPAQPLPYWYSPSYVDLPAYPTIYGR